MIEVGLSGRQQFDIDLATSNPLRVDKQLALGIDELVSVADGSIANGSHRRDLFGILRLAYEM